MTYRIFALFIVSLSASFLNAQTIAFPDSAAVIKNKVKVAKVYFNSSDGKRYLQKQLTYDKQGRLTTERENESTFYYEYAYDKKGRRILSTQRTRDGEFIQKSQEEYIDSNATRRVSLFLSADTSYAPYVYTYDKAGKKIREEQYNRLGLTYVYAYTYNAEGKQIASYDSIGYQQTVSFHENDRLVKRRTYNPQNKFLHEYIYGYDKNGAIVSINDSTGVMPVVHYELTVIPGKPAKWTRDKQAMDDTETNMFRKEFFYVFPFDDGQEDYGLPSPGVVNEHHFTYDKNGNITRDDLVQSQGSFSQTYVYEYEYEFYK